MATINELILGQLRVATGGTAETLYAPGSGVKGIVKQIQICETSGNADTYSIFVDADGTTADQTTAIAFGVAIAANAIATLNVWIPLDNPGSIRVTCATTNRVTFTATGVEIT